MGLVNHLFANKTHDKKTIYLFIDIFLFSLHPSCLSWLVQLQRYYYE